jgi:hypothetical protein
MILCAALLKLWLQDRMGVALPPEIFGGNWLPFMPRRQELNVYVGAALPVPHTPQPTQAEIDETHARYCAELRRLFDGAKGRVQGFEDFELELIDHS